jgi:hypothetical protein
VKRAGIVLLVWAGLLAVNTAVMPIFHPTFASVALLGGASLATAATGLALLLLSRRVRDDDPGERIAVTELSVASAWTGLGVALLALSARFGVFLAVIAGGMILFGLGGIVRELRAQARAGGEARR